jgi:hypothetical protein
MKQNEGEGEGEGACREWTVEGVGQVVLWKVSSRNRKPTN